MKDADGNQRDQASMRPPQKAGGNPRLRPRMRVLFVASMRPPQKAGGNRQIERRDAEEAELQ